MKDHVDDEEADKDKGSTRDIVNDPRFIRLTFDVTVHLMDRPTLQRNGATTSALEMCDQLCEQSGSTLSTPSWDLSVPAMSLGLAIGTSPKKNTLLPCGDLMKRVRSSAFSAKAEDDDYSGNEGEEDKDVPEEDASYEPMRGANIYAVRTRVWTVDDPDKEARDAAEAENKEFKSRFSSAPFELRCSLDDFANSRTICVQERYNGHNDPAELATSWSWSEGEAEFDLDTQIPVRAAVAAAELLNRDLLVNRNAAECLTRKDDPAPYYFEQVGVAMCLAKHVLGNDATLPEEIVAVVHERHCVAGAIARAPARVNAKRLVSRAVGAMVVGTVKGGNDGEPVRLACAMESRHRFMVMPLAMYVDMMKKLRQDAITAVDRLVPVGSVKLRIDPKSSGGKERLVHAVTTYVQFKACPSLLLRRGIHSLGSGWQAVSLRLGDHKYTDPADGWHNHVDILQQFCAALLKDGNFEALDIDEKTGEVNLDNLARLLWNKINEDKST